MTSELATAVVLRSGDHLTVIPSILLWLFSVPSLSLISLFFLILLLLLHLHLRVAQQSYFCYQLIMLTKSNKLLLFLNLTVVFTLVFYYGLFKDLALVRLGNGWLVGSDFFYHHLFMKSFWTGSVRTIYQLPSQLQILSEYAKTSIGTAMPVGMTPIYLLLWIPLLLVGKDINLACSLWMGISFSLLFVGLIVFWDRFPKSRGLPLSLLVASALVSHHVVVSLALGQTAFFAVGLLLLLYFSSNQNHSHSTAFGHSLLLAGLAVKPPYFLFGTAILLMQKRFKELFWGLMMLLVAIALLTLWLGGSWITDYLQQIDTYLTVPVASEYAQSVLSGRENSFAMLLQSFLSTEKSLWLSNLLWISLSLLALLSGFLNSLKVKFLTKSAPFFCVFLIAAYILLAPYVGEYEEIVLLAAVVIAVSERQNKPLRFIEGIGLAAIFFALFNRQLLFSDLSLYVIWSLKAAICLYSALICLPSKLEIPHNTQALKN